VRVRAARVVADESLASDHQPLVVECEWEAVGGV
jgi:endonuclease/exonuclease/phosphatase family metal-dependent hydrolase